MNINDDAMTRIADNLNRIADAMEAWNIPTPCDYDDDCDELWRLAREYVSLASEPAAELNPRAVAAGERFVAFVREHTP